MIWDAGWWRLSAGDGDAERMREFARPIEWAGRGGRSMGSGAYTLERNKLVVVCREDKAYCSVAACRLRFRCL